MRIAHPPADRNHIQQSQGCFKGKACSLEHILWAQAIPDRGASQVAQQYRICLIPGSGRSPGAENNNPLQYSCLGNPTDRGAWFAAVHGIAKNQTLLSDSHTHAQLSDETPWPLGSDWGESVTKQEEIKLSSTFLVAQTVKKLPAMEKTRI